MRGYNAYYKGECLNSKVLTKDQVDKFRHSNKPIRKVNSEEHKVIEIPVSKIRFVECIVL